MANKGRVPPHLLRPLPGPGMVHPDPYASAIPPPRGGFPPFEMLPPHEVMEQKLSAQHIEIEKLATENRRLAATHGTLRQDLGTSKHELQLVHAHIADMNAEKEQQIRGVMDRMSIMESELGAAEQIKMELQQARAEAQKLAATRQELISKVQQLTHDLQMAHSEAQQIPSLMAELDGLRQEYQHCSATYEYEKKLYSDHLESLQVMEKNYMAMSREVEKLQAELSNFGPRTGGPYGGSAGYSEHVPLGNYASGQNAYGLGQMGQVSFMGGGGAAGAAHAAGNSPHVAVRSAPYSSETGHDVSRVPGYGASRGHVGAGYDTQKGYAASSYDAQRVQAASTYDAQRGPTGPGHDALVGSTASAHNYLTGPAYEAQRGQRSDAPWGGGYEGQRTPGYDSHKGSAYDGQKAPPYDMQRGSGGEVRRGADYDNQKGPNYNPPSVGTAGPHAQVTMHNAAYASTPGARTGAGHQSVPPGGNPVHK